MRTLIVTAITGGAFGYLFFVELSTSEEMIAFAREKVERGDNVVIATATDGVEATLCESLSHQAPVVQAGSVAIEDIVNIDSAPGERFQSARVTLGALAVWDPNVWVSSHGSLVVGSSAAEILGVGVDSRVGYSGTVHSVSAVLSEFQRNARAEGWLLELSHPFGLADECWVEFAAGGNQVGTEVISSRLAGQTEVRLTPLLRDDQFSRNPATEFERRGQRLYWVIAGLVGFAAWTAFLIPRRSELGLYRSLGTGISGAWTIVASEIWTITTASLALGLSWAPALWLMTRDVPEQSALAVAARSTLLAYLAVIMLSPLATIPTSLGSVANQIKDL